MTIMQSRRRFVTNAAWAGAAGLGGFGVAGLGGRGTSFAEEPPPEITTIRFEKDPVTCIAPQVVQALLRAEGFTDIRYVGVTEAYVRSFPTAPIPTMLARGEVDFARDFAASHLLVMDAGAPITLLTGLHSGCFEVIGKEDIHTVGDLKGRTVGALYGDEVLLRIMAGLVGLDYARDIHWTFSDHPMDDFIDGKIDAFLTNPPLLQEARARNIGHVVLSSIADRPWSQYYCCYLATRTEFARQYPVATKRVLRAILKAVDLCVSDPKLIAQLLVDQGYTSRYDYALQALSEIRYGVWREYDPEDSLRFYALRMHEAGLVKSSPNQLIAEHTDWRFLNELKRELKA
jgi:NitT/TauT family transport system substrate-binding protein